MKRTGLFLVTLSLFGCDLTQDLGGSGGTTGGGGATDTGGAGTGGDTTTGGSAGMTMTGGAGGDTGTAGSGGVTATGGSGGAGTEWALSSPNGQVRPIAVTVDGNGDITVAGTFSGSADIGAGAVTSKGMADAFVIRYTREGSVVWAKIYGSTGDDRATEIGSDAAGNLYVAGTFEGSIDLGSGLVTSQGGQDIFLLKLDPSGDTVWSKSLGGGGAGSSIPFHRDLSLAVGAAGDVTIADSFLDPVHLGAVVLNATGPNAAGAGSDFFVARLDAAGNHVWSHEYGDPDSDATLAEVVSDIGVDASGNVFVTGHFGGAMSFGGATLGAAGSTKMLALKLDPAGNHVWSKAFGGAQSVSDVLAVTSDGGVVIAGVYSALLDFDGVALPPSPADSLFTAKLDATGATVFTHQIVCPAGSCYLQGAAADASGSAGIGGGTEMQIDFGAGPVQAVWSGDHPFYGRYDASGAVLTGKLYEGTPMPPAIANGGVMDLAYDKTTGHVILVGVLGLGDTDVDFGPAKVSGTAGVSMFVVRLSP